jgi:hypothetical protein
MKGDWDEAEKRIQHCGQLESYKRTMTLQAEPKTREPDNGSCPSPLKRCKRMRWCPGAFVKEVEDKLEKEKSEWREESEKNKNKVAAAMVVADEMVQGLLITAQQEPMWKNNIVKLVWQWWFWWYQLNTLARMLDISRETTTLDAFDLDFNAIYRLQQTIRILDQYYRGRLVYNEQLFDSGLNKATEIMVKAISENVEDEAPWFCSVVEDNSLPVSQNTGICGQGKIREVHVVRHNGHKFVRLQIHQALTADEYSVHIQRSDFNDVSPKLQGFINFISEITNFEIVTEHLRLKKV